MIFEVISLALLLFVLLLLDVLFYFIWLVITIS